MKEGSKKDVAEDRRNAKKRGMTLGQWEKSPADARHDAGMKKGGKVKKPRRPPPPMAPPVDPAAMMQAAGPVMGGQPPMMKGGGRVRGVGAAMRGFGSIKR